MSPSVHMREIVRITIAAIGDQADPLTVIRVVMEELTAYAHQFQDNTWHEEDVA